MLLVRTKPPRISIAPLLVRRVNAVPDTYLQLVGSAAVDEDLGAVAYGWARVQNRLPFPVPTLC